MFTASATISRRYSVAVQAHIAVLTNNSGGFPSFDRVLAVQASTLTKQSGQEPRRTQLRGILVCTTAPRSMSGINVRKSHWADLRSLTKQSQNSEHQCEAKVESIVDKGGQSWT